MPDYWVLKTVHGYFVAFVIESWSVQVEFDFTVMRLFGENGPLLI